MELNEKRQEIIQKLMDEEETENSLIWLYDTLLDLGVENCFPLQYRDQFRVKMKILADESRKHNLMLERIKENYK